MPPIEIITIEDSIVTQNNSTITIDNTTISEQSLDSMQRMDQDSNLSLSSSQTSTNLTNSLTLSHRNLFIQSCPVHSHHHEFMDLSICPDDPPCVCIVEIE